MPAIYIIATVLVLLFLIGAYRMMGAGASIDEDLRTVLDAVLATTDAAATSLAATAESGDAEGAHAVRRQLDGCAQALERIAATPVVESLDRARSALERAVDELTWSARLVEAPAWRRDESLRAASRALRSQGAANVAQARSAIEVSALP
ncbi:MAG: hypothetical protein WCB51_14870 [Candidatus Dormiibacterota bacterium]